jgi:hypothetical protein
MPSRVLLVTFLFVTACGGKTANITVGAMPEGGTFHGVWQSTQYGRMHLCQSQDVVVGEYAKDERHGRLQGRVRGDTLRFEWTDEREMVVGRPNITNGHGYFQFRTSYEVPGEAEGEMHTVNLFNLQGEWGIGDDEVGGGEWDAMLMPRERPTDCYASARSPAGSRGSGDEDPNDIRFSDEEESSDSTTTTPDPGTTDDSSGSN